jgi:hypothetical protein
MPIDPSALAREGTRPFKFPPLLLQLRKTRTTLAKEAIAQLNTAEPGIVTEAITIIKNKKLTPSGLIGLLERKVRIGEVLNDVPKNWTVETKTDFAEAFQMDVTRLEAMHSIVSIAILNASDLDEALRVENTPEPTPDELSNRKVVWQSVPAGTELKPPYTILLAVEYRDVAKAEDVVKSIMGELLNYQNFVMLPRVAVQKL